jgi:mannose-6-phosphate isomerase-like protein (cupin superfamily)
MRTLWLAVGLIAGWGTGLAQNTPDVYSQADLTGMETQLMTKADAHGLASEILKKYSTDYSMLGFRSQSGQAEQHAKFADFYVVLDGSATLISGGTMAGGATTAPGELRGASIQDGKQTKLQKGDIVHIPANIPHQLMLPKGSTLKYFIIKVQEVE